MKGICQISHARRAQSIVKDLVAHLSREKSLMNYFLFYAHNVISFYKFYIFPYPGTSPLDLDLPYRAYLGKI